MKNLLWISFLILTMISGHGFASGDTDGDPTLQQKVAFLKSWNPKTDVEKLQKEALLAEAENDYARMCAFGEQIVSRDDVQDLDLLITHFSLQRCYENLGERVNEIKELKWLNGNALYSGRYHTLMKQNVSQDIFAHVVKRYKKLLKKDPLEENMRERMEEQGYEAEVERTGNMLTLGPKHYEKGKTPISALEQQVHDEYIAELNAKWADATSSEDKQSIKNQVATKIAEKYNMTVMNLSYLVLKVGYNEVAPNSYVPPSKPD